MDLGLDIGSVSLKFALFDNDRLVKVEYLRHSGYPFDLLNRILTTYPDIKHLALTGGSGSLLGELIGGQVVNEIVATVEGVRFAAPNLHTVIEMGGEDSKLFVIDGELKDFTTNTICAAGTGIFLDQQAHRLNLSIEDFGHFALRSQKPARIAGRCSVFAKSDMIHLQQIGTPMADIIAGLCRSLARNFKSVIARGKSFEKPIGFIGGVAANLGLVRAFESVLGLDESTLIVPEYFNCLGAIGAWLNSLKTGRLKEYVGLEKLIEYISKPKTAKRMEPLNGHGIQSARISCEPSDKKVQGYLGIDVGSVSTNLVVIDEKNRVLSRRYLWTQGDPVKAVKIGLEAVEKDLAGKVKIIGVGTTGSGRYLAGDFVGADVIKNEITAQATAAIEFDREVDTIFEIGGQDSKFVSLEKGVVLDFEMNKVCAAGTGSFLEEQAKILDVEIEEFGDLALHSKAPVFLGERCTVFMESEMLHHQHLFTSKEDLLAGLAYSIAENYLNRVVQGKKVGNHILFQGGVAANKAVIAAFEKVLKKKIIVPENFDVTGAIGAAMIAREEKRDGTRFKGFGLAQKDFKAKAFECTGCTNLCDVNIVEVAGEKPLFYGGRCEKYERREQEKKVSKPDYFNWRNEVFFKTEEKKGESIGIPRTLIFYELFPLFSRFLTNLGFKVVVSDKTNKSITHLGVEHSATETCFPVKVANGHIMNLVEKGVDRLFLASVINMQENEGFEYSCVCPYVQTLPYSIRAGLAEKLSQIEIVEPVFSFDRSIREMILSPEKLARKLGVSKRRLHDALEDALGYQRLITQEISNKGKEVLESVKELGFVVVSRPYNGYDHGVNLDLPLKIEQLGLDAMPMDFLPLRFADIRDEFHNMYWHYGQRLLAAASYIRDNPMLYAIYLSNFSCGPDSFLVRYFKELMGDKPFLFLELDEHSADAGLITRLEAFLDSIKGKGKVFKPRTIRTENRVRKDKKVYIPYMCDHALVLDAAMHSAGVNSEVMTGSDEQTLVLGRQYTTGRECFPAILTSGDMIKATQRKDFDPENSAFFMPQGTGPCRFGQYHRLHRLILDELGFPEVPILSPSQGITLFEDLNPLGYKFILRAWQGIVAVDAIDTLSRRLRPYEETRGETQKIYDFYLREICQSIEKGKGIDPLLKRSRQDFSQVAKEPRRAPRIGIVGEIFVRANPCSNNDLVRTLEALGAEVLLPPITEWFLYINFTRIRDFWMRKEIRRYLTNWMIDAYQSYEEHRIYRKTGLEVEASEEELLAYAAPYIHDSYEGEAVLSVGKTIDFIKQGADGVINVMPFTCMPGNIVATIYKKLKEDFRDFPLLILSFDGLDHATDQMRIEAFVHQAKARLKG